jgi:hypothetical protein
MKRILRTAFLTAMLVATSRTWAAEPLTFTITEYLHESWNQERVSFPVSLPEDLNLQRLAVRDTDGRTADAGGTLPNWSVWPAKKSSLSRRSRTSIQAHRFSVT